LLKNWNKPVVVRIYVCMFVILPHSRSVCINDRISDQIIFFLSCMHVINGK
jgi:hypothetical protein